MKKDMSTYYVPTILVIIDTYWRLKKFQNTEHSFDDSLPAVN